MFNRLALALLCLAFHHASAKAEVQTHDREIVRQIATNLNTLINGGKLERRNLSITAKKGHVTVTGRIEDARESRLILDAILTAGNVSGLELNLGIGREPSCAVRPVRDSELGKTPLSWGNDDWPLDFGREPIRHGTMP